MTPGFIAAAMLEDGFVELSKRTCSPRFETQYTLEVVSTIDEATGDPSVAHIVERVQYGDLPRALEDLRELGHLADVSEVLAQVREVAYA
jgi:hypothetical protein